MHTPTILALHSLCMAIAMLAIYYTKEEKKQPMANSKLGYCCLALVFVILSRITSLQTINLSEIFFHTSIQSHIAKRNTHMARTHKSFIEIEDI